MNDLEDDVAGEYDAGSPGSDGASPYLRRAFPRQPATYLSAYGLKTPDLIVQPLISYFGDRTLD
jgi:hypothetical protein